MKHPKKQLRQKHDSKTGGGQNTIRSGAVTSMVGKDTFSLTFNIEVANTLNFKHNESLDYEIIGDRLIIRKR
jgi:hypothetical protein